MSQANLATALVIPFEHLRMTDVEVVARGPVFCLFNSNQSTVTSLYAAYITHLIFKYFE